MADQLNRFLNLIRGKKAAKPGNSSSSKRHIVTRQDMIDLVESVMDVLPDPDLVLKKLGKTPSVYRETETDAHVGGCLLQRRSKTKLSEVIFVAGQNEVDGKETPDSVAARDLVARTFTEIKTKRGLRSLINEILESTYYGATYLELFWNKVPTSPELPAGAIILENILGKPFEWFGYNDDGRLGIRTSVSLLSDDLRNIPENKIVSVVYNGSYRNPYGERSVKRVYWPYIFKKGGFTFWAEFIEKFGMPFLLGRLDSKKSDEDLEKFTEDLSLMVRNGVMAVKNDGNTKDTIEAIESKSRGDSSGAYKAYKDAMNIEMSKAILGETLTIENSESGSQAATKFHKEILEDLQDEDRLTVEETFEKIARIITNLNFGKEVPSPTCRLINRKEEKKTIAEKDKILANDLGVKFSKSYIAKTYEIEENDFEVEGGPSTPANGEPDPSVPAGNGEPDPSPNADPEAPKQNDPGQFSDYAAGFPIQDGVDQYLDAQFKAVKGITKPLSDKLKETVKKSESYEDLFFNLAMLKDGIDNKLFSDVWGQALLVFDVVGEWAALNNKS